MVGWWSIAGRGLAEADWRQGPMIHQRLSREALRDGRQHEGPIGPTTTFSQGYVSTGYQSTSIEIDEAIEGCP
jgi:hypothetical protein